MNRNSVNRKGERESITAVGIAVAMVLCELNE